MRDPPLRGTLLSGGPRGPEAGSSPAVGDALEQDSGVQGLWPRGMWPGPLMNSQPGGKEPHPSSVTCGDTRAQEGAAGALCDLLGCQRSGSALGKAWGVCTGTSRTEMVKGS